MSSCTLHLAQVYGTSDSVEQAGDQKTIELWGVSFLEGVDANSMIPMGYGQSANLTVAATLTLTGLDPCLSLILILMSYDGEVGKKLVKRQRFRYGKRRVVLRALAIHMSWCL